MERALLEFRAEGVNLAGRAAVTVPYFGAVAPLIQVTDVVATLPRRFALWLMQQTPLVFLDLPYSPMTVDWEMVWHQRANRDKGLQWLRQELVSSTAELG
jgi:DNA-binding transcriptional LysR family regulator